MARTARALPVLLIAAAAFAFLGPVVFVPLGSTILDRHPAPTQRLPWGQHEGHERAAQMVRYADAGVVQAPAVATTSGVQAVSQVLSPAETYQALVAKGKKNSLMPVMKIFHQSFVGGIYVGFAGLLSLAIAGNLGVAAQVAPGVQKFVFAALFPVNLLLVLLSGGQLFTGNSATVPMAVIEGEVGMRDLAKSWAVSMLGNILGCGSFACAANFAGLFTPGAQALAQSMCLMKTSLPFAKAFVRAIMCNWMVCMAVFLCEAARDMAGKMVGIWFPISAFVAMGMEHSVANMFLIPAGILCGAPVTVGKMILKNWIPVLCGNAFAGVVCIACSYSFAFGKLGR